jgi:capsid protein
MLQSLSTAVSRARRSVGQWIAGIAEPHRKRRGISEEAVVSARYDSAQTYHGNERYWRNADAFTADQANNRQVRETIRQRAIYETCEANSLLKGIVSTLVNYTVGRGPRLQVQTRKDDINALIEKHWRVWSKRIGLNKKVWSLRHARCVEGESFAVRFNNPRLPATHVQLDIQLVPCSLNTDSQPETDTHVDGIDLDAYGQPTRYYFRTSTTTLDTETYPAERVIHLFKPDRIGQHHAVSEIATALPMAAIQRDYILAVQKNARSAASITGVIETTGSTDPEQRAVQSGDELTLNHDNLFALDDGAKMNVLHPAHPMSEMSQFLDDTTAIEIRCLDMPLSIAKMSFTNSYSSSQMDAQGFDKAVGVDRSLHLEEPLLDRLFGWFVEELALLGIVEQSALDEILSEELELSHVWHWDGFEHADPAKVRKAEDVALRNHTLTLAEAYAKRGLDWDQQLAQRGKEIARMAELKLLPMDGQPAEELPADEGEDDVPPPAKKASYKPAQPRSIREGQPV